jgi:hypothetical protein
MFEEWMEDLENTVYVYFSQDLDSLVELYGIDLEYYFENDYSAMEVVTDIQNMLEEDDFEDE